MRFTPAEIDQFAAWSADTNPLHVDPAFARETHFGQRVVHGVLTVLETLAAAPSAEPTTGLDIEFRHAVFAGEAYEVRQGSPLPVDVIGLAQGDTLVLAVTRLHQAGRLPASAGSWFEAASGHNPRPQPATPTMADLTRGIVVRGSYPNAVTPHPAAARAGLSATQARVLALCSYVTGMEVPGFRSLFTRISLTFHCDTVTGATLRYQATTTHVDPAFRMLDTALEVVSEHGEPVASAVLRSYVPFSPAQTDFAELAAHVSDARAQLSGKSVLIVGASRGLGADLAAACALAGSHVYASARHLDQSAGAWQERLAAAGATVTWLEGDAADETWARRALETIVARHGRLDAVVLNACAPPVSTRVSAGGQREAQRYVRDNLALVETPLAAFAEAVATAHGAIVHVSSSYVEDTPAGYGPYVAVKQAGEALVRTLARERRETAVVIARPPMLQTRWNDTPAAVAGTLPASTAAVHIVRQLARTWAETGLAVLASFPPLAPMAVAAAVAEDDDSETPAAIRLVASFTTDALLAPLRFWLKEAGIEGRIDLAPYGQLMQSLLDPASALNRPGSGVNVVLVRVRDWLRELADAQAQDIGFVQPYVQQMTRDLEAALRAHRAQSPAETVLVICPSHGAHSAAEGIVLRQAEADLLAAADAIAGVHPVDAARLHADYEVDDDLVHDPLRDDLAHIPYQDAYQHVLASIITRLVHRRRTPVRKVVVVDCDNTLWRGVVGEVGAEGVEFDAGHRALHATLTRLAASGVLVALCSKNEEPDVWRVFETRPELGLDRAHVVAGMINWQPKSENLKTLARRLNLGLDSFIFLDDNPVECAEVRAGCPDVLTVQWPQESALAERLLRHMWELDGGKATKEDERRTEMYREEFRRQEARADTLTFEDFIKNLQLEIDFRPLVPEDLRRAAQLTLRTNQFNFTTIRREEADVQALEATGRYDIRTVRVRDRFGDYGLVGLLIAERAPETWNLDTFLLSCRVLGRGVEHHILAELGRQAASMGATTVALRVETTRRNTPARSFLASVIPAEYQKDDGQLLECVVPAAVLAAIRFEPAITGEVIVADDAPAKVTQPIDAGGLRRREAAIARAAFALGSGAEMLAAATGRPAPPSPTGGDGARESDIRAVVEEAFATALRVPAAHVAQVDGLEALGCDSLRIVEITVALRARFPWLPTTLLFEHRSVSQIVAEIVALARPVVADSGTALTASAQRSAGPASGDIAVVGLNVRCAGANSPAELWSLLSGARSAVRPVPLDRPFFLHPLRDGRSHWAGLIDDPARFDATFFGVSPREAEYMDPQLRLFLEVAAGALEDAGLVGAAHTPETGVFAGVMYGDYGSRANINDPDAASPYRCWEGFSLANRLSQLLGFHGPSLAVDTACSSSGTALHLACRALNAHECEAAVVGGVNLILDPDRFASLGRLGILSARGQCEPFGADADGTVLGEGAGVVILRRLDDAVARGERVYGVIKGSGLSTGSGTVGFTAPNPQAQADAIRRSIAAAGIDPRTVSYVETHGTGTALGDPIEVRGLTLGYGTPALRDEALSIVARCAIGSIKPNIGHLEAGAGVLGLIKVLLQLQHRQLLPSITSPQPNPQIPFAEGTFSVQRVLADWVAPVGTDAHGRRQTLPRRAGLSSFGVGGANAHIIVEEAPPHARQRVAAPDRPVHVLALSADSDAGVRRQAEALRAQLESPDAVADVCFSVNTGRRHLAARAAVPVATPAQLATALDELARGTELTRGVTGHGRGAPRIAFVFTGQGAQYAGMGRALYETQPVFRDAIDRCAAVFDALLDRPLRDLLFATGTAGDPELLNQTGYTQPALFAFEYAMAMLWQSWGVTPDFVLGHSVGEIAAMCVADGVSLEDGARLIAARGRLMQALPAGGVMTSVMADEPRVLRALAGRESSVAIAAINAPGQIVISGAGVAVAAVEAELSAEGIKTKALAVSHAFHSPLMQPMLADFEAVVRQIRFTAPRVPIVSCVDAVRADGEVTDPAYWLRQVMAPVRFAAGARALEAAGADTFIEIGPHPVLLGMARQSVADESAIEFLPSMRRGTPEWETLAGSVAALYARGGEIDWRAFDAPYDRQRVSVPTYAFGGKPYWLAFATGPSAPRLAGTAPLLQRQAETLALEWRVQPLPPTTLVEPARWIVVAADSALLAPLTAALTLRGTVVVVDPLASGALDERLHTLVREPSPGSTHIVIVDEGSGGEGEAFRDGTITRRLERALAAMRVLEATKGSRLWIATHGAMAATPQSHPVDVAAASLWGLGRTLALEHPDQWGGLIDLQDTDSARAAAALARELVADSGEDQVALTEAGRLVARLAPVTVPDTSPIVLDGNATYLVTGGLGALGRRAASWLVQRGARHLVLVSRRAVAGDAAVSEVERLLQSGAAVTVSAADMANPADVARVLDAIAQSGARLDGIVHAAGIDATVATDQLTPRDLAAMLGGKAGGAWLLHEATRHLPLSLFVCFSSMSAVFGAQGRAHYAAANACLDALIAERRRLGLTGHSLAWGPWRGGGMASEGHLEQFERIGNHGLDPAAALAALTRITASRLPAVVIADIDWPTFRAAYEARRRRPLLAELADSSVRGTSTPTDAAPWVAELHAAAPADRAQQLESLVRAEVANTLGFDSAASVPLDRNFYEIGMDSLMMADLVGRLKKRVGFSCSALVFDQPTVSGLAARLLVKMPLEERSSQVLAPAAPLPVARTATATDHSRATGTTPYRVDAEADIFAFQHAAWPRRQPDLIPARWRWMFVESARRLQIDPVVWLYRDAGRIVGHMGSIPVRVKVGAHELPTGWLVDTMVLQDYRGHAVGSRLMVDAHDEQPFSLSLGQTAEMREIQLRLGWKQVAPLQVAQLLVRPGNVLKGKLPAPAAWAAGIGLRASSAMRDLLGERTTLTTRAVDRYDARHDALWATMATDLTCAVVRDASYLNWKYVDQPGQSFQRLDVMDGSTLRATAVWMFREPDSVYQYKRGFLVDLVAPLNDRGGLEQVLKAACAGTAVHEPDALLCHHIHPRLSEGLRGIGFTLREPERYLLVDPGALESATLAALLAADNWYVTQGDSDIDRPW